MPLNPPSNTVITPCNGPIYTPAMILSFLVISPFKGMFEEFLSDIYLLDLAEVKQAYRH